MRHIESFPIHGSLDVKRSIEKSPTKKALNRLTEAWRLGFAFESTLTRTGFWRHGVSMDVVRRHPAPHLLELAQELRTGLYRADKPIDFQVAKLDGTTRRITVFHVRDRVVQRAVLGLVGKSAEALFSDCSYGFRPGLGVEMAVCRAKEWIRKGNRWLAHADIASCFDSINQNQALSLLKAVSGQPDIVDLIRQWLPSGGRGLPQGMALESQAPRYRGPSALVDRQCNMEWIEASPTQTRSEDST